MFKIGDKVVCIEATGSLIQDGEYTVLGNKQLEDGPAIQVKIGVVHWLEHRFKLVEASVVFNEGDLVRIKTAEQIKATFTKPNYTENLYCPVDLFHHCGREFVLNQRNMYERHWYSFGWSWHELWLEHVQGEEMKADKNGRLRDANGRFAKNIAKAPKPKAAPVADKGVETIRDEINKRLANGNAGTCTFGIQFEKKNYIEVRGPCHAGIAWGEYRHGATGRPLFVALNVKGHYDHQFDAVTQPTYKEFVQWFIKDSPWAFYILTKNINEALEKGVLVDVKAQPSWVACTAIALRTASEFQAWLPLWKRLKDDGVDGYTAYIVANYARKDGAKYVYNPLAGGHHIINCNMKAKSLALVKTEGLFPVEKHAYDDKCSQYRIFQSMESWPTDGNNITIGDFISKFGKGDGSPWGGGVKALSYKDIIQACIEFEKLM